MSSFDDKNKIWKQRPVVLALSIAVALVGGFLAGGAFVDSSFANYVYNYNLLFVGGTIILSIPIFYNATRSTLRSDLLDREIIEENKERFANFSGYEKSPLVQSVYRLYLEAGDQRSYATKNLAIGMGLTLVSAIVIVSLIVTSRATDIAALETERFLYTYLLPRASGVLIIQLVGGFFLRWYSQNVGRIGELSERILLIEVMLAAQVLAGEDEKSKRDVLKEQLLTFDLSKLSQKTGDPDRLDRAVIRKIANNTSVSFSNQEK